MLLADSQSLFREAVKSVLESESDVEVVGEAADGLEAVAQAMQTTPDVAVLDANLPNCDGIRATAMIGERVADCRVLILSGEEDEQLLIRALEAGACGYLTKTAPLPDLIGGIRAVHRGEAHVPPHMLRPLLARLLNRSREHDEAVQRISALTPREREVLALLADGGDNDSIAQALVISPQTARTHIQNVLSKLDVHSRLEAAAFAQRNGLIGYLVSTAS